MVCLTDSLARSPPSSLAPRSVGPRLNRQSREGCLLLVGRLVVGRGGGGGGGLAAAASHKPGCTAQRGGGLGSGRAYDHYTTTTRFTNKSRIGRRRTDGRTDGRTDSDGRRRQLHIDVSPAPRVRGVCISASPTLPRIERGAFCVYEIVIAYRSFARENPRKEKKGKRRVSEGARANCSTVQ